MDRRIIWGTLAAVVCISNALLWLRPWQPAPAPVAKSGDSEAIQELRQQVGELKQVRATDVMLAARMANPPPAAAGNAPADAANERDATPPPSTSASEAEQEEEAARAEAAVLSHLDQSFAMEKPDSRWSGVASNEAARALTNSMPKGSILGVINCRSSMCRIESTHENLDAFRAFNDAAFAKAERMPWNGGVYSAVREQSSRGIVAVSYLAKEGQSLPFEAAATE